MFLFMLSDAARKVSRCVGVVPTDVLWQDGLQELPPYPKNLHNIIVRVWKMFHLFRSCQVEAGHKGAADQPKGQRQYYAGVTKPDQISCWNHPSLQILCKMFIFLIVISHQVIVSNISSFASSSALALESPTRASSTKLWGKRVGIDEKSWAARNYYGSDGRPARRCL